MNKQILLGLLLVPCAAHTMEHLIPMLSGQILKYEDDKCLRYWRGDLDQYFVKAEYNKETGEYTSRAQLRNLTYEHDDNPTLVPGLTESDNTLAIISGVGPQGVTPKDFLALKAAYEQQQEVQ